MVLLSKVLLGLEMMRISRVDDGPVNNGNSFSKLDSGVKEGDSKHFKMYPSMKPMMGGTNCFSSLGMFLTSTMARPVCYK